MLDSKHGVIIAVIINRFVFTSKGYYVSIFDNDFCVNCKAYFISLKLPSSFLPEL